MLKNFNSPPRGTLQPLLRLHQEFVCCCLVKFVSHTKRYWRKRNVAIKIISIDCDNRWAVNVATPELRGGEKRKEDEGADGG